MYGRISSNFIIEFFCIFLSNFLHSRKHVDLKLILRNLYTSGAIRLKSFTLYLTKVMVISFGIIGFLLAINFFAFWGVAPCNLVDYMSVLGENVTWAACNSLMFIDLHAFPLWFGDRESRVLCYRSESRWLDPRWRQWLFYWHKKFRSHCEPGDDSAPKRNEYQEYFLVVKTDGRKADNLP